VRYDGSLGQSRSTRGVDVDEFVVVVNLRLVGLLTAGSGEQGVQVLGLRDVLLSLGVVVLIIELEQGKAFGQILGHIGNRFEEVLAVD